MGYSRAVKVSILRRVLPPNNESIAKVSEEMGLNDQTIRNWVKAASEGQLLSEETSPRFINAQEKYLLIKPKFPDQKSHNPLSLNQLRGFPRVLYPCKLRQSICFIWN